MTGDGRSRGPFHKGIKTHLDAMLDFGKPDAQESGELTRTDIERLKQIILKLKELNARVEQLAARLDSIA